MPLLVVLNELSHAVPAPTRQDGAARMQVLATVLRDLSRHRPDAVLVSQTKIKGIWLAQGYTVGQWSEEPRWREEWQKLRGMENRSPFRPATDHGQTDLVMEYTWENLPAEGFGWAHCLGGLSASFFVTPFDDRLQITLRRNLCVEEVDGNLCFLDEEVSIPHVATLSHVASALAEIMEIGRGRPENGHLMWTERANLFPRIQFLPRVEDQLNNLVPGHPWLNSVFDRLRELDSALETWDPTMASEPVWASKVTPEHESRKRLCVFNDMDGESRCFDSHARFTPGFGRIHFRLDGMNRKMIVAHVGEKIGA
jgi:hypothetical protein